MPVNKARQVQPTRTEKQEASTVRKAPGTRMGTFEDWRGGFIKSGKTPSRHGHGIRDGR